MTKTGHDQLPADQMPEFLADDPNGAATDAATAGDLAGFAEDPAVDGAAPVAATAFPERRTRVRRAVDREAVASGPGVALGVLTIAVGVALGVAQQFLHAPGLDRLGTFGINATTLVTLGAVMAGTSLVRRHVGRALARLDAVIAQQDDAAEVVQNDLQFLVEAQNAAAQRPPAAGEELQRVMIAMQRQDEKLNNITKALKMYGKPLMEISNQGADAVAAVNAQKTHLDAMLEASRQGFQRLEIGLRNGLCKKEVEDVGLQVLRIEEQLQKGLAALGDRLPRGDQLQQQLVRVEATVQALGQRTDDSEIKKSLLRLEDSSQRTAEQLTRLAQGESVQVAAQRLEQRLDAAAQKLHGGLEALRSGNLGTVETTLRDIQREVSGVATSVAQIQSAVKNGTMRAPAPGTAPAATAPAAPAVAASPAPTPAPSATEAVPAGTTAASDAQAGAQQNVSGTRATSGKNVLGAIAKLKQMKT